MNISPSRVALVTGGTKNIGLAIVKRLLLDKYRVAFVGSSAQSIDECTKKHFLDVHECKGYVCDLSKPELFKSLFADVESHFGRLDVLVNNAGLLDMSSVENTNEAEWDNLLAVNLKAPFFLVQSSLELLKRSDHPRVINISSNAGRMGGFSNGMSYTASKGGLISLTYGLARQLAKHKITVNCVAPGTIESDMLLARDEDTRNKLLQRFPLGRFGQSSEVADAVAYFSSVNSDFTTGAVLDVNGGLFTG